MSGFSLKAIRFCFQFYFYSFTLIDIMGDDQQTFWFPLQMLPQQNSNISSRRASDKLIFRLQHIYILRNHHNVRNAFSWIFLFF